MPSPRSPGKNRLSRDTWLDFGLAVLRDDGPQALKADPLCKRMGVSRGSFYWHFDSAGSFALAVLERWESIATDQIIRAIEEAADDALARLRLLLTNVGELDIGLYQAINTLGAQDPGAAQVLRRVHERRVAFVANLLAGLGFDAAEAATRAQLIYAWAMGELLTREPGRKAFSAAQIDAVERLLMRR
ncbi:TetR/AcrR family transcriptional regulator [Massilia sp. CCM 9210]|uniref:TetR/AcrR family transcriptional regulator n=1 Tax=Massilia scottii TaxID=3057166 RepID=UPI00279694AA|nr:TetR/AcrR family transcriptional regulator [Massilia sp. CCM 9210]MDQ1813866.1 TetR/AcrR family transcriptional regulator [Massilia sp. CCM 9210]